MLLNRWSPTTPSRTFERFNKMMEEFFADGETEFRTAWLPTVDVKETDKELTFLAELPGLQEKDIQVELVGDTLTIRGERNLSSEEKKDDYVRVERSYGAFQRSFSIDVPVRADEIKAEYKNGLLTVCVPKAENVTPKRIPVAGA